MRISERGRTRRVGLRVGVVVAALAFGCNTAPCACPPAASSLVFYGQVLTAASSPVDGAVVEVRLESPACVFSASGPPALTATTDAQGRFRTAGYQAAAGTGVCVSVTARRSGALIATAEGLLVRFPRAPNGRDSVGFVLRGRE